SAKKSRLVLEKYTKKKFEKDFESKITIAKSKWEAAKNNLEIEQKQLAEIKEQLDACNIICPEGKSGQVVYANIFSRRGSSEFILEEGASVREGQVLIRLPNPNKMQVRATVNESRVTSIKEGMDVKISVDALNGRELSGSVNKVNQYAEPEGWGGGGVRKYAIYIDVNNPIPEIRPGMNASVLVQTARIEDALMIPIQCVYGYRGKTFCLKKAGDLWKTVEVQVGANNDTNVIVEGGLERGEVVALNPAGFKELLDLPDLPEVNESEKGDSGKRSFGKDVKKEGGRGKGQKSKNRPGRSTPNPNQKSKKTNSGPNDDSASLLRSRDRKKA
ncbi:MAG: efflux RND transporter periplasmic adaptor subunit, partial [Planctomycetota bacterium]|nr:efflux RND transporter periplasmic adaptor subunit [Planctomycetota bacterium]